jgi:FMN phosphatase YigB (HAD superfamily)
VDRFDYALVTCYENSHATKSNPAYLRELADFLERKPAACLMVGDNWGWDVVCAGKAGIPSYWIATDGARPPEPAVPVVGHGDLDFVLAAAEDGSLEESWAQRVARGHAV